MLDSGTKLKHLPFFDAMAQAEDGSERWRACSAGLLTLRVVDAWLERGVSKTLPRDGFSFVAVREAVEAIEERHSLREILSGVLDAVTTPKAGLRACAPKLMAYGQLLEFDAEWTLAADVYATIVAHAHPTVEADLATQAHLRSGICLRQMGRLTESVDAYRTAGEIASRAGDLVGVLRGRIGEAKAAIARGNLPDADAILRDTVERAAENKAVDVQSMALHDRAMVAHLRGDYELAVRFGYDALEISKSPRERDRILGDIATMFRKLGVRSAAHDAYVILAATAQEQYGRWAATLNLMELASDEGQEVLFEHFRRTVSEPDLPVDLRVSYLRIRGVALTRFGQSGAGRALLTRAIALAEENDLNHYAFEARTALESVSNASDTRPPGSVAVPDALEGIARQVSYRRQALGV